MDPKVCESLVPDGVRLYQLLVDPDVSPEVHILTGRETDSDMQALFLEAGFSQVQETVVIGLAVNGPKKQMVLIRANAMHHMYQFLQTLWHELGHFSFRKENPGIFFDLMSDPQKVWFEPIMQGIVLKFWDESIAQCAANKVINRMPEESRDILCPDAKQFIQAERDTMHYFLKRCLNQGEIDFDLPLLNILKIPFSPYCLAIYCAEAAANPWDDFLNRDCECDDCACNMDLVKEPIHDLVALVRQQYLQEQSFELSECVMNQTTSCFIRLSEALDVDEKTMKMMGSSLAEVTAAIIA